MRLSGTKRDIYRHISLLEIFLYVYLFSRVSQFNLLVDWTVTTHYIVDSHGGRKPALLLYKSGRERIRGAFLSVGLAEHIVGR